MRLGRTQHDIIIGIGSVRWRRGLGSTFLAGKSAQPTAGEQQSADGAGWHRSNNRVADCDCDLDRLGHRPRFGSDADIRMDGPIGCDIQRGERCFTERPALLESERDHHVRCHIPAEERRSIAREVLSSPVSWHYLALKGPMTT